MTIKQFQTSRSVIAAAIGMTVAIAAVSNNFYLAVTAILIGILFMFLVRCRLKQVIVDERLINVSGKASRVAYTVGTFAFAFIGLFIMMYGRRIQDNGLEIAGTILSYAAMFNIMLYTISFYFFNKKYGGE